MERPFKTHYDNLKVSWDAPPEVIRMAYKALVNKYHPDRNPNCSKSLRVMQIINVSYETLSDPTKKATHDRWIRAKLLEQKRSTTNPSQERSEPGPSRERYTSESASHSQPNTPSSARAQSANPKSKGSGCIWVAVIGIALLVLLSNTKSCATSSKSYEKPSPISIPLSTPRQRTETTFDPSPRIPKFNEPAEPLPPSGEKSVRANLTVKAPFEIKTSRGVNYFVKLTDSTTKIDVVTVFVRGGDTIELDVPLGTFKVKYASGNTWYGDTHLFGPDTQYAQTEEDFTFSQAFDPTALRQIALLKIDLATLDIEFKTHMLKNGLSEKRTLQMFSGVDGKSGLIGLNRYDNAWWKKNILSHLENSPDLYNECVDRLNKRNQISNTISTLSAEAEDISGYSVTLYKVANGNLETERISKENF